MKVYGPKVIVPPGWLNILMYLFLVALNGVTVYLFSYQLFLCVLLIPLIGWAPLLLMLGYLGFLVFLGLMMTAVTDTVEVIAH